LSNYESVLLEVLGRVQKLESRVEFLERNQANQVLATPSNVTNAEEQEDEQDEENRITRSAARQFVMDKVNKTYGFFEAIKGNRAAGADIIVKGKSGNVQGKSLKAKFYYSKSHLDFPSGWHTVKDGDLKRNDIDLHIFVVMFNTEYHTFMFTQDHLRQFVQHKRLGSHNQYYFYFHVLPNKITEERDDERDVSANYEQWDIFGEIIKNK
jgi:hypothetical protein